MKKLNIPDIIEDRIFQIKFESDKSIFKITSYFPLSALDSQILTSLLDYPDSLEFDSIFTDKITVDEWNKTKNQIKKRFQNELFDINSKL